jgi:5-methylcytosine-specific restriction enzyme subunit McrC
MNTKNPIVTYEFGTLCIEGQVLKEGDVALSESTFENLWDFILSSKATDDTDVIMSVHKRGGRRYIKTGRYVGTIQTKNGQTIEILPKIYKASGQQEKDVSVCRNVFLNMLKHFTDFKARSFQNASLNTKKGFPILEVYISNYIRAVEELLVGGLKKSYALVEENQYFLKGKLDIGKQITKNITNKARFVIRYN